MNCPQCNTANASDAVQCFHCGASLQEIPPLASTQINFTSSSSFSGPTFEGSFSVLNTPSQSSKLVPWVVGAISIFAVVFGIYWIKYRVSSSSLSTLDSSVPSNWRDFTSTGAQPNYSLKYPSDWKSQEISRSGLFTSQDVQGIINVIFEPNQSGFSEFYKNAQSAVMQNIPHEKIINHRVYQINGLQAEQSEIQYVGPISRALLYGVNTDILSGSSLYRIDMSVNYMDRNIAQYKLIYTKLVNSFSISQ